MHALGLGATAADVSAQMPVDVRTWAATQPSCIAGTLFCHGDSITADGQRTVSLDDLTVHADALGPGVVQIAQILVDGFRCQLTRHQEGNFGLAGVESIPVTAPARRARQLPRNRPRRAASPPSLPWQWSIGELRLHQVGATLHDLSYPGRADPQLRIEDLRLCNLGRVREAATQMTATLVAPGSLHQILLTATALPFAPLPSGHMNVEVQDISLDALAPYFAAAGLECRLDPRQPHLLGSCLHLAHPVGADKNRSPIGQPPAWPTPKPCWTSTTCTSAAWALTQRGILSSPKRWKSAGRNSRRAWRASGALQTMGFCMLAGRTYSPQGDSPASAPTPSTAAASTTPWPRLKIDKFLWNNIHFRYDDQSTSPATTFGVSDAGVEIHDLLLDLNPQAPRRGSGGHLHAWLERHPALNDGRSANPRHAAAATSRGRRWN